MTGSNDCPVNGDYNDYPGIIMSNGSNTYVDGNCFSSCSQTVQGNDGTDWQVTDTEPAGNGSVEVGPEMQQQTDHWCTSENTWDSKLPNGCSDIAWAPLSAFSAWSSGYTDFMPHNSQTIAEAAYDVWTNYPSDIMVWQDTVGRCNSGAYGGTTLATGVKIGNFTYDVYRYGGAGAEVIFVAEGSGGVGTCGNYSTGTVDLYGVLKKAEALGVVSNITVGLIDFTFEICSTGGVPETFGVSKYSMSTS